MTRLLDLGVPHFLILSTVVGVVAQRLVRRTCHACAEAYQPTAEDLVVLGLPLEVLGQHRLRRGASYLQCRQTGYAGRDGVFQVMPVTGRLRGLMIARQCTSVDLFEAARQEGMRTLREAAAEKVLQGVTTVAEMVRVVGAAV